MMYCTTHIHHQSPKSKAWKQEDRVYAVNALKSGVSPDDVCTKLGIKRRRLDTMLYKLQTSVNELQNFV